MSNLVTLKLLPAGRRLEVPLGTPLRDVLFEHGVEFPCGGRGRCKGCRIRVLEGALPIHDEERERLSQRELTEGWRLACLGSAEANMTLELAQWEAAILTDESRFEFTPGIGCGVAIDLGTTTIVAQLVNLATGDVLAVATGLNAQARHGADIMSRVEFAVSQRGQKALESDVRTQLKEMLGELMAGQEMARELAKVVIVGNTVMHHLFCGIDVEPLSQYPFEPLTPGLQRFSCKELGWKVPGDPEVLFLPCAGGFVGSDILAGIAATGLHESESLMALMDLGTNGEIVVGTRDRMLCASTAAGPAFEGARISMGMRASTGAISEVWMENGRVRCHVIGGGPARGICGSGLVDAVAMGLDAGTVRSNGRIASGDGLALDGSVSLTQWDIRELQMAKGAIAAGLRVLVKEYGARMEDLDLICLAGAFGNYINLGSGRRIGLLNLPLEKIRPSGNTALLGAKLALFGNEPAFCKGLLQRIRHVSLNEFEGFQDLYAEEMLFPQQW